MGKDGVYTAAKGFSALQSPHSSIFPPAIWNLVWNSHCMPKVNFFMWLALKNKLLTSDNLSKRGLNGPFWCSLCKCALENADHLFVDCVFARTAWEQILHDLNLTFPA